MLALDPQQDALGQKLLDADDVLQGALGLELGVAVAPRQVRGIVGFL